MPCPTCDHTMSKIASAPPTFWCPRCGTIKDTTGSEEPSLVNRVIQFAGKLTEDHEDLIAEFERLGIRESITTVGQ